MFFLRNTRIIELCVFNKKFIWTYVCGPPYYIRKEVCIHWSYIDHMKSRLFLTLFISVQGTEVKIVRFLTNDLLKLVNVKFLSQSKEFFMQTE